MTTIEKLNFRLHQSSNDENSAIINNLIDKVNELTEKVNELNYEVGTIHEWKIEKEGI
ncbi:MAG: hypothetical protein UR43_C0019G0012 [candidate division TM6 bacterium GW2011_GWF2_33_332]|nr:MAG: hypothetical protein UR43_C0019G0012 [candidate division TM6 bacterium GW2011_GWF2_33_332]